jgi:hypothetical protein
MNTTDIRTLCDRADAYAAQTPITLTIQGERLTLKIDKGTLTQYPERAALLNALAAADVPADIAWGPTHHMFNYKYDRNPTDGTRRKVCVPKTPSMLTSVPWESIAGKVADVIRERLFDGDASYHDDCLDCAFEVVEALTGETCPSRYRA